MERTEALCDGGQRLLDLYLFQLLDLEQGELNVLRKRPIIIPFEYRVGLKQMIGEFPPHNHGILKMIRNCCSRHKNPMGGEITAVGRVLSGVVCRRRLSLRAVAARRC